MASVSKRTGQTLDDTGAASGQVDDSALRQLPGYNLKRAYLSVHDAFLAAAVEFDLRTSSYSCLAVIVANPDVVPSRLAEALRMERSNLVIVLDALERRDLISRRRLDTDRRYFALRATPKGRRLHDEATKAIAASENERLAVLDDAERETLFQLLRKIDRPAGQEGDRNAG